MRSAKLDSVEHFEKGGGLSLFYIKVNKSPNFFAVSGREFGTAFAEVKGQNYC